MLKIMISCGLGMSSSAVTQHLKEEIIERGWQDKVSVDYIPFPTLMNEPDTVDANIILLCPHLMYYAKDAIKKGLVKIPMYIIPALLYGSMNLLYLVEDSIDLLETNKKDPQMLLHFPEEKLLEIKRNVSHRRWIKKHQVTL